MDQNQTKPEMTAAEAAELVVREVPVLDKAGKDIGEVEEVAVKASEVLSFRDYGGHVVVVTTDGKKLTSEKAVSKKTTGKKTTGKKVAE